LGERPPFAGGNVRKHQVAQQAPAPERAVGGENQTALAAGLDELRLVEMRVILGLHVDERLRAEPDRLIQHGDVEIRHPDVAREALPFRPGERGNGLAERDRRVRPMHQEKIDEIDVEIS